MTAPFVLIDNSTGQPGAGAYLYENPLRIITAHSLDEVAPALSNLDAAMADGFYVAGYMAYEAGYAFEHRLAEKCPALDSPLLWFGVFETRQALTPRQAETLWADETGAAENFALSSTAAEYEKDIARILDYLQAGDCYQINHTLRGTFTLSGTARGLYKALRPGQRVAHGAFIETGDRQILSLSPELFLQRDGDVLTSRPMKGTAPRPPIPARDDEAAHALVADEKSRAENLMIVDLIRNDLSRVATPGSVSVPALFTLERYRTFLTMTSTVRATAQDGLGLAEIMPALFPCGSVTGAPKIRAMEIIAELEPTPRGAYCGAIGHGEPGGNFAFNVPIRTLEITDGTQGLMGVGSGIVADSKAASEYDECWLKARFLTQPVPDFEVFETTKIVDREIFLLEEHLARLQSSCRWFGFPFDETAIRAALKKEVAAAPTRLRFAVGFDGTLNITTQPLTPEMVPTRGTVVWANTPTQADDPFLHHKTTNRALYNAAMAKAMEAGHLDALFINETGAVTEGARTNIFIQKGDTLLTPPLDAGVLPGTLRHSLLARGTATEATLTRTDIESAEKLYIGNSVMGLVQVTLVA